jgi:hypothetical protein
VVSMESRASDAGGVSPRSRDQSNSALVVVHGGGHEEDEGQLKHDDSNQVVSQGISAALPQSVTGESVSREILGIAASRSRESGRGLLLALMGH